MTKHFPLLSLLFLGKILAAQPSNDGCDAPINLPDVTNFCSAVGQYNNAGATPSGATAACMAADDNDIWFSFTATATDVDIIIRGKTATSPGGTLKKPEVALYLGSCSSGGFNLSELQCTDDAPGAGIVELYKGGLYVGQQYLVRVQGDGANTGTFQICVNNFNPPVQPQSDCPKSAILCDKSPFVVQNIVGFGQDPSELDDATCFVGGIPGNNETNSTWYSWTCSKSGTLEFTLTPSNPTDDLDFVLYELPNGLANCTGKNLVRCMAAGDFNFPSPCMGPTGLKAGSSDLSETSGCGSGKDNFIKPLDMEAGKSYALGVNNFTSTGNGFNIEFGGTGEFLGPQADFTTVPSEVCLGIPIVFTDASQFPIGAITKYNWSFGIDAVPSTASGKGPHTVQFSKPGIHSIVMTIETSLGCKVTDIKTVLVHPPVEIDTVIAAPDCNGGTNGEVQIKNIKSGTPPYLFSWNGGAYTSMNSLSGLPVGIYNVKIKDKNNCETSFDINVKEKELAVAPDIMPPLCTGQSNGQVILNVTNGTAPFIFNWGSQPGSGTSPRVNLPAGTYTVSATDAELCKGLFTINIVDHPPVVVDMDTTDVTCHGKGDGRSIAKASGGVGNFTYQWSSTTGPISQTSDEATNLSPDNYFVTVTDGNGCTAIGSAYIDEPPPLDLDISGVKNVLCFGDKTGVFHVSAAGGTVPFSFSADGVNFTSVDSLGGLMAGRYWVYVKDSLGCLDSIQAEITEPAELKVTAEQDSTLELGYSYDVFTTVLPPFRPVTYQWSPVLGLSCADCPEPTVTATESTVYILKITDEDGCMDTDSLRVTVTKRRPIYPPNAMGPDLNSPNDRFTLYGSPGADLIEVLRIYDRWGDLLFENKNFALNDPQLGWDGSFRGKLVDSGVYAFYARVHFIDGESLIYKGDITVVR